MGKRVRKENAVRKQKRKDKSRSKLEKRNRIAKEGHSVQRKGAGLLTHFYQDLRFT